MLLRAEREARSEFFCGLREKSQYARPDPTQPDLITLLRSLYLWNGLTDSRAVFFVRCHHSINFVFDRHRFPPVPATARGTCRGEGVGDTLSIGNSTTAGPIAFKFGVCLETSWLLLLNKSEVGWISTCARVCPSSISRKRLDGLRSNFVY